MLICANPEETIGSLSENKAKQALLQVLLLSICISRFAVPNYLGAGRLIPIYPGKGNLFMQQQTVRFSELLRLCQMLCARCQKETVLCYKIVDNSPVERCGWTTTASWSAYGSCVARSEDGLVTMNR